MTENYKLIIANQKLHKEISLLSSEKKQYRIGTAKEADIRFRIEDFFESFEFVLEYIEGEWNIYCSNSVFILEGEIRKLSSKHLVHGDAFAIKYTKSGQPLFQMWFLCDFGNEKKDYGKKIRLQNIDKIKIGRSTENEIVLNDTLMEDEKVCFYRENAQWFIEDQGFTYGVYLNGKPIWRCAAIKDGDFIELLGYGFYYKENCLFATANEKLQVNHIPCVENVSMDTKEDYPEFIRNTRLHTVLSEETISLLQPPAMPQKNTSNVVLSLLPALGMLTMVILLRGVLGSGGTYVIFSVCSLSIGIITSVFSFFSNNRKYKKSVKRREETYKRYLEEKRKEIEEAREKESRDFEKIYYSLEEEYNMVKTFSSKLFERSPADTDYLQLYLGVGQLPAKRKIQCDLQEKLELEDALEAIPEKIKKQYHNVKQVPILCDLKECNAVGIVGEKVDKETILRNSIMDLCTRHFYTDVKIYVIVADKNASLIRCMRMLPHLQNAELDIRNIGCDAESRNVIFEYLYKKLSEKESEGKTEPRDIIFVYDACGLKQHPLSKFIHKASQLGSCFLLFENQMEMLPQGCDNIINVSEGKGKLIHTDNCEESYSFSYQKISETRMEEVATALAPIHSKEVSLEGTMTKKITLYELFHLNHISEITLQERWKQAKVYESLAAPIGLGSKNKQIFLDIHEKAHGPHGLVAGTTGAGKSELLQTYILSMAMSYAPSDVGFLIIDFKGGGMANQFAKLPHLLGSITNIEGKEIKRSLKFIQAELKKRQNQFAQAGVNHIDSYIRMCKEGSNREVIPHLIVIVDEFAELKAQQPEFMKELISAARIGRSLGVHLILATQKPAGQVNEQIWSNSKFKMCLKVQNKNDSNEVLKSPLAAEIKEPGRCYLQVGNNEIFELFQSAYSGENMEENTVGREREFCIHEVELSGKRKIVFEQKNQVEKSTITQLDSVVDFIATYCKTEHITSAKEICLPILSKSIPYPVEEKEYLTKKEGLFVEVGIADDPQMQRQKEICMDLSQTNLIAIGSSQSGKTNLLLTIIKSLTEKYTPLECNFYGIDFSSMMLKNLEKMRHCGGIVCTNEDEKLKNLFQMLFQMITERREKMLEAGVSSFRAYREAGYKEFPYVVLFIDNLTALKELYLMEDNSLVKLTREGLAAGISIIVVNPQTTGIGYQYLSNFSTRIAFHCNDTGEYGVLFEQSKWSVEKIPGRCLVELERRLLESQIYLPFSSEKEMERVIELRAYVEQINEKTEGNARRIPVIPSVVTLQALQQEFDLSANPFAITCGLNYANVEPYFIDLEKVGVLALVGGEEKQQEAFVKNMSVECQLLQEQKECHAVEITLIGEQSTDWEGIEELEVIKEHTNQPERIKDILAVLEMTLAERYQKCSTESKALEKETLQVLVIKNREAIEQISHDVETMTCYRNIVKKYLSMKVCILWLGIANNLIPYNAPEVLRYIKDGKKFLVYEDLKNIQVTDISLVAAKQFKKPIEAGDVYYICESDIVKIKMLANPTLFR